MDNMDVLYVLLVGKYVVQTAMIAKTGLVIADKCKSCYRLYRKVYRPYTKDCLFCGEEDGFMVISK